MLPALGAALTVLVAAFSAWLVPVALEMLMFIAILTQGILYARRAPAGVRTVYA